MARAYGRLSAAALLKDSALGKRGGIKDNTIRDRATRLQTVLDEADTKQKTVHNPHS